MKKAKFYIFAGINGAGKTTLYYNALEKGELLGNRINIDEFVSSFGDWRNEQDQARASKIAIKQRKACIKNKQTFNLETTLSGKSIFKIINDAKEQGYIINLYYVGLEHKEIAKDRVEERMKKGGHFVSGKIIDRRYPKSLQNLSQILDKVDNAFIYDNTKNFKLVAKKIDNNIKIMENVSWLEKVFDNKIDLM